MILIRRELSINLLLSLLTLKMGRDSTRTSPNRRLPRIKLLPHAKANSDKQAKRKMKARILTNILGIDRFDRLFKPAVKLLPSYIASRYQESEIIQVRDDYRRIVTTTCATYVQILWCKMFLRLHISLNEDKGHLNNDNNFN